MTWHWSCSAAGAKTVLVCWCRHDVAVGPIGNPGLGGERPRRLLAQMQRSELRASMLELLLPTHTLTCEFEQQGVGDLEKGLNG